MTTITLFDPPRRQETDRRLVWADLTERRQQLVRARVRENPLFTKRDPDSWLFVAACLRTMEEMLAAGEIAVEGG